MNESERAEGIQMRVRGGAREGNANESARGTGDASESERGDRARGIQTR